MHAHGANAGPVFEGLAAAGKQRVGAALASVSEEGGAAKVCDTSKPHAQLVALIWHQRTPTVIYVMY